MRFQSTQPRGTNTLFMHCSLGGSCGFCGSRLGGSTRGRGGHSFPEVGRSVDDPHLSSVETEAVGGQPAPGADQLLAHRRKLVAADVEALAVGGHFVCHNAEPPPRRPHQRPVSTTHLQTAAAVAAVTGSVLVPVDPQGKIWLQKGLL